MTTNNTTLQILQQLRHGPTAAAILAKAVGRSESVVRETLVKLVQAEQVVMDATVKPRTFALPTPVEAKPAKAARKAKSTEAKVKRQAKDYGDPAARKSPNPQATITRRKELLKQAGVSLEWVGKGRVWMLTGPDGFTLELSSREFAARDTTSLLQAIEAHEESEEGDE